MKRAAILSSLALALPTVLAQPAPPLPAIPFPPENPFTEEKRVLGKILFWDEQLSADNTVACGTCHKPQLAAGADPRLGLNPGVDGLTGTPDDILGSPGVIRCDPNGAYAPDPVFELFTQVTGRAANPAVIAMFADDIFWDGRATSDFIDPETGAVSIPAGGALESQAVGPPVSDVEMAHEGRDWTQIRAKLTAARPLALASDLPPDMAAVLASRPSYPDLFEDAFGTPKVTAERIAFAIATYERTLVPDQTPYDAFAAGDTNALTPGQQAGFNALAASNCLLCHTQPFFSDHTFRNVGLRPIAEDNGRQGVTGNPGDAGRFKVPTLRNVGLKATFMHNGQLLTLNQVLDFYAQVNGQQQFPQNRDPIMQIVNVPPPARPAMLDFLENALTDPRLASGSFPFDRPALATDRPANPRLVGAGQVAGTGGIVPEMIAVVPPNLGNADFKIGVRGALAGATAFVAISSKPPVDGVVAPDELHGPITLGTTPAGAGYATFAWPIPDDEMLLGARRWMQWRIDDPGAPGGQARTRAARIAFVCAPCDCPGDLNGDRLIDLTDLAVLLGNFGNGGATPADGDIDGDGDVDLSDLATQLARFGIDCGVGQ